MVGNFRVGENKRCRIMYVGIGWDDAYLVQCKRGYIFDDDRKEKMYFTMEEAVEATKKIVERKDGKNIKA